MRILITARNKQPCLFPYNYQYTLHSAIYSLINKSSYGYSKFLHDNGYIKNGINKNFKLFTFSKFKFFPHNRDKNGFHNVKKIQFIFSSPIDKNIKHLILGIFSNRTIKLTLNNKEYVFTIESIDIQPEPIFSNSEKFICLSPIAVTTIKIDENKKRKQHFLNYMIPEERNHFINNLKKNLINKYETINNNKYQSSNDFFNFNFDINYIAKQMGNISKLKEFKNKIKIKAIEAPFRIEADPKLIKIGYECGWGEKNSAGFGCVERI